jgi:hypothetical protein
MRRNMNNKVHNVKNKGERIEKMGRKRIGKKRKD